MRGQFAVALGRSPPPAEAAALIGLEHEYRITHDGLRVDFRDLIHELGVQGLRLDPGDRNAYRCAAGSVLTCDDEEAEVAVPPVPVRPGFTRAISSWAESGRRMVASLLPADFAVDGYSTHLSAGVPEPFTAPVARLYALTFAPALMLMVDNVGSEGVFVRPRPGRLELCGEYVAGERLRGATALFAGGARLCAAAAAGEVRARDGMPPALDARVAPATGRYGLYVGRHSAFGFDLYRSGRKAILPLAAGGTITAQEHLELAWNAARTALGPWAGGVDLDAAEGMVTGSSPLGIEGDEWDQLQQRTPAGQTGPSPFGDLLSVRRRRGFTVSPRVATWDFTVFNVAGRRRTAYACVPRDLLPTFLDRLDDGRLDRILATYVESDPAGRILGSHGQTQEAGLWDDVGDEIELLHPERGPQGSFTESGAHPRKKARPGKLLLAPVLEDAAEPPAEPPTAPPPAAPTSLVPTPKKALPLAGLLAALVIAVLAGGAVAATNLWGGSKDPPPVSAVTSSTSAGAVLPEPTSTEPTSTSAPVTSIDPQAATTRPGTTTTTRPRPTTTPSKPVTTTRPASSSTVKSTVEPPPTTTNPPPTTSPAATTTTTTRPPNVVTVGGACKFTPTSMTRPNGTTLTFVNTSGVAVSVLVSAPGAAPDSTIALGIGQQASYTLTVTGTYFIECNGNGSSGMQVIST